MSDDEPDIADELVGMAANHKLFTKAELASKMIQAAEVINTLRVLVGIRADLELEDVEPEGNA